jgi:hypothetical protein
MSMRAFGYGVMGDLPGPGVPFREDPSLSASAKWVNPQKHHFFTLPTRAEQDAVRNANDAMNKAIQQLLHAGVMPRWILQTANRFAAQAMRSALRRFAERPFDVGVGR